MYTPLKDLRFAFRQLIKSPGFGLPLVLTLALLGCRLGVLGSLAVSRLVRSFLFEVSATDPLVYAAGVLIMILMALVASPIPATLAASPDPMDALR